MEASFNGRVDQTFGALFRPQACSSRDVSSNFWTVSEQPIAANKEASRQAEESSGSDSDEPCGASYKSSVKLEGSRRRGRHQSERETWSFAEGDLYELESDDGGNDGDDDEEGRRYGKRKKKGEVNGKDLEVGFRGEREGEGEGEGEDSEEEFREIRQMVGMDETLDLEEEEDEYDKVAVGGEGAGECLFMGQFKDFSCPHDNSLSPLPSTVSEMHQAPRDARANHQAALARLEEDDREAAAAGGLAKPAPGVHAERGLDMGEGARGSGDISSMVEDITCRQGVDDDAMDIDGSDGLQYVELCLDSRDRKQPMAHAKLETCLVSSHRKSGKRVRFDIAESESQGEDLQPARRAGFRAMVAANDRYSQVPHYIRHPSKYIHYTVDWSDEGDEKPNSAAFQAVREGPFDKGPIVKGQEEELSLESEGRLGPICYTPRTNGRSTGKGRQEEMPKRTGDFLGTVVGENGDLGSVVELRAPPGVQTMGVAAGIDRPEDEQEGSNAIGLEDGSGNGGSQDMVGNRPTRVVRRYRSKANSQDDDLESG